ncbi:hypothetical protein Tco_0412434 [Tanacetum coccineum]
MESSTLLLEILQGILLLRLNLLSDHRPDSQAQDDERPKVDDSEINPCAEDLKDSSSSQFKDTHRAT